MEIEIRELGLGRVEIRPAGRLVEETVGHLRADLLDNYQGPAAVLLNLSRLSEIDAAGMALVLLARVEREAMGGRLVVESANPRSPSPSSRPAWTASSGSRSAGSTPFT